MGKAEIGKTDRWSWAISAFCFHHFCSSLTGKRDQPGFQDKLATIGVHSRFLQFRPDGEGKT
jgi:hypothetical protein